jgi:adenosylmethionine-8-amino-7-oxononanoate aminotransferase
MHDPNDLEARAKHLAALDHAHLWHPFTPQLRWTQAEPLIVDRAEGNELIDVQGRRYLDGVSSLWTNVHGHRHPALDQALRDQLDKVAHSTMLGLTHPPAIELAARLAAITPEGLERVFFSDNGSTATEIALKMAYQFQQQVGQTQRTRFAALRDAYHGDTIGAVSVGSIDLFHEVYRPLLFDAVALPAPVRPGGDEEAACLEEALRRLDAHADELAAIIVEPLVQGAAGMKMHSVDYLRPLLQRARAHGILVVADEVAVGFGRLGTLFAMEQVGIAPDLLCLAKGLSGGYLPLAATVTTERVYEGFLAAPEAYKQFFHGHTFTGNPLACAVALANLGLFDDDLSTHVEQLTEALADALDAHVAAHPACADIRQHGVMIGIDLQAPGGGEPPAQAGHALAMATRRHGAITRPLGNTLVLNPPLRLGLDEADRLVGAVRAAMDDLWP